MLRNQSVIDPTKTVDEKQWVVSVLNTVKSKAGLIDGHSAIVVEGVEEKSSRQFIGQYDIGVAGFHGSVNTEGHISKIKCYENEHNSRDYQKEKFPAESFYASPQAAKRMIESIKQDADRTEQGIANHTRHNRGQPPLHFDFNGKPIEPLKYQKLGKNHFLVKVFGDTGAGDNCAGWCIEKLAIAGIGDGTAKPKPAWIAGQIPCASFFKRPLYVAATAALVVGTAITAAYCRRRS